MVGKEWKVAKDYWGIYRRYSLASIYVCAKGQPDKIAIWAFHVFYLFSLWGRRGEVLEHMKITMVW